MEQYVIYMIMAVVLLTVFLVCLINTDAASDNKDPANYWPNQHKIFRREWDNLNNGITLHYDSAGPTFMYGCGEYMFRHTDYLVSVPWPIQNEIKDKLMKFDKNKSKEDNGLFLYATTISGNDIYCFEGTKSPVFYRNEMINEIMDI